MKTEYESLVEALGTLASARRELSKQEPGFTSPAWTMVFHAEMHVTKIADGVLRQAVRS